MPLILIKPTLEERFCLRSYIQHSSTSSSSSSSSSSPQPPAEEIQLVSYGLSDPLQQDIYEILMVWKKKKKIKRVDFFFFFFFSVFIFSPIKQGFTSQLAVFNYFFFLLQRRFESCVSFSTQMLCCLYFLLTQMGFFFFFFFCRRVDKDFYLGRWEEWTEICRHSPHRPLSTW